MSAFDRRLERLRSMSEVRSMSEGVGSEACEECGHGLPGPVHYEVSWEHDGSLCERSEPDPAPEFCGTCGRQIVYEVRWPDDADE